MRAPDWRKTAFPSRDRKGVPMGLRPTKKDEGVRDWCRGISNLDRAFNRAVLAVRVLGHESFQ